MSIKSKLGGVYYTARKAIQPCKNTWSVTQLTKDAMRGYRQAQGYSFDINKPELFTEKVIWYKLFFDRPGLVNVVDKYLFKSYLAEHAGEEYVVPLYGAWTDLDALKRDWDGLPESFCLKSTLKSDSQFIKIVHRKADIDLDSLLREVNEWLKPKNTMLNSCCRAYYEAVPRVIAEKLISGIDQSYDYKFFCFNGKPHCIYTYANRFENENNAATEDYALTFYDLNWHKIDAQIGGKRNADVPKPVHFHEMLKVAEILSRPFPFVRVDFYETPDKVYVGELTLYPSGGLLKYEPREFNKRLGELFVLPEDESIFARGK